MKKLNVIWLLIDSVRTYRSGLDDRDRLDVFDEMANESIEFTKVITSAPSSVMSVSAMMTSVPAWKIARDYDNFRINPSEFPSLPQLLKNEGYQSRGQAFFFEGREKFSGLFDQIEKKHWPKRLQYGERYWSNDNMNLILESFINESIQPPFFLFAHYNIREDYETSDKVKKIIGLLKQKGLFNDSIFIMCSDHGYPDPSRGMDASWFKGRGLSHDLVLTNDNIMIPLIIRYPGATPRKIPTMVSSLDITPTVLDILDVNVPLNMKKAMEGRSLLPLLQNPETEKDIASRFIRVDNRFFLQSCRSVALLKQDKKYVFDYDTNNEGFFNIASDPFEKSNLINDIAVQKDIAVFKNELVKESKKSLQFHMSNIAKGIEGHLSEVGNSKISITLIDLNSSGTIELIIDAIHGNMHIGSIALIAKHPNKTNAVQLEFREAEDVESATNELTKVRADKSKKHVVIILLNTYKDIFRYAAIAKVCKEVVFLGPNLEVVDGRGEKRSLFNRFLSRAKSYSKEPMVIPGDVKRIAKKLFGRLKK